MSSGSAPAMTWLFVRTNRPGRGSGADDHARAALLVGPPGPALGRLVALQGDDVDDRPGDDLGDQLEGPVDLVELLILPGEALVDRVLGAGLLDPGRPWPARRGAPPGRAGSAAEDRSGRTTRPSAKPSARTERAGPSRRSVASSSRKLHGRRGRSGGGNVAGTRSNGPTAPSRRPVLGSSAEVYDTRSRASQSSEAASNSRRAARHGPERRTGGPPSKVRRPARAARRCRRRCRSRAGLRGQRPDSLMSIS